MKSFFQFVAESLLLPAQRLKYSEFKRIPGPKNLQFSVDALRRAMTNTKAKHWVVFSLGPSFHDPQEMFKIVSGPKVPDGIQEITMALELRAAWRHIQDERNRAYSFSRRSG